MSQAHSRQRQSEQAPRSESGHESTAAGDNAFAASQIGRGEQEPESDLLSDAPSERKKQGSKPGDPPDGDDGASDAPPEVAVVAKDPAPPPDPGPPVDDGPKTTDVSAEITPLVADANAVQAEAGGLSGLSSGESVELDDAAGTAICAEAKEIAAAAESQKAMSLAEEDALIAGAVGKMNVDEKRGMLGEMGYTSKALAKMNAGDMDKALSGTFQQQALTTRVQGMSPEELAAFAMGDKRRFLSGLGIPREDLDKAKDGPVSAAFQQVVEYSKVPGNHKVKLEIKGGFFKKKSYDLTVNVNQEGGLEGVDVKKNGGFFSKLGSIVKMALPVIASLLAPITGGLSLMALGAYNAIQAARKGDWLGMAIAIAGSVGGMGGEAFQKLGMVAKSGAGATLKSIANVATNIKNVAIATKAGLAAVQAKSPGGLLTALATGATAVAGLVAGQAENFAKTLNTWAERLETTGKVVSGTEAILKAAKGKDPFAAISAALDVVTAVYDHKNKPVTTKDADGKDVVVQSTTSKNLDIAQNITGHAAKVKKALGTNPPGFAAIAESVLGMATEFSNNGKLDIAQKLAGNANALQKAIAGKDPAEIAEALLGIAESIEHAKAGADDKDKTQAITTKYNRLEEVASASIGVVQAVRTGDWAAAVSSSSQLVAELSENGMVDAAAGVADKSAKLAKAIQSKNPKAIAEAAADLGKAVQGAWTESKKKKAAEPVAPGAAPPVVPNMPLLDGPITVPSPEGGDELDPGLSGEAGSEGESEAGQAPLTSRPVHVDPLTALPGTPANQPAATTAPKPTKPKLVYEASVAEAQRFLNQLAVADGNAAALAEDGKAGDKTVAAIRAFQKDNKLPVTGVPDSATIAKLRAAVAKIPQPDASQATPPGPSDSQRKAAADLGSVKKLDGGFADKAGSLLQGLVPKPGDKVSAKLSVKIPINLAASVMISFATEASRNSKGKYKLGVNLGIGVRGEADAWIATAFAEARINGYMEATGDSMVECFNLLILQLHENVKTVPKVGAKLAGWMFNGEEMKSIVAGMGDGDSVTAGLQVSGSAGVTANGKDRGVGVTGDFSNTLTRDPKTGQLINTGKKDVSLQLPPVATPFGAWAGSIKYTSENGQFKGLSLGGKTEMSASFQKLSDPAIIRSVLLGLATGISYAVHALSTTKPEFQQPLANLAKAIKEGSAAGLVLDHGAIALLKKAGAADSTLGMKLQVSSTAGYDVKSGASFELEFAKKTGFTISAGGRASVELEMVSSIAKISFG